MDVNGYDYKTSHRKKNNDHAVNITIPMTATVLVIITVTGNIFSIIASLKRISSPLVFEGKHLNINKLQ